MSTLHEFTMKSIDGEEKSLADFEGRAVLVVNVASKCGLTPQYEGLEQLHETYGDRGFAVLGFPCNQFGAQEPGSEDEIKSFCTTNYGVTFPMFAKVEVNGEGAHPLYQWLRSQRTEPDGPGDIAWNFAKFLVAKDGRVIARFSPKSDPMSGEVVSAVEKALA